jgi:rubrerythrin
VPKPKREENECAILVAEKKYGTCQNLRQRFEKRLLAVEDVCICDVCGSMIDERAPDQRPICEIAKTRLGVLNRSAKVYSDVTAFSLIN